ncbi:cell surface glycoprotein [Halosolutus amylolyticus]|uniref:Cell surface glycoprotein n=1 Tax=Halosolutus amylolyticus TaxID=2932267 RepID=A0ABD5PUW0_9EURY|nr:cell surface glycoprotein [Halosolutus amylolyticus]
MTGDRSRTNALAVALAAIVLCSIVGTGLAAAGAANPTTDAADRPPIDGDGTNDADASVAAHAQDDTNGDASFTAYGQEGTIILGGDREVVFPESDEDEPQPENAPENVEWEDESFVIDADVDLEEGTWEADAEDVAIPLITSFNVDADRAEVQMSAPNGFEGTIDPETGEMTAEADFEIESEVIGPLRGIAPDSTCVTETELEMTTGTSDNGLEGTPFEVDAESGTATATLVDDTFAVPGFDTVDGVGPVCGSAADEFGLPAEESGDNEFEIELWFDLEGFEESPENGDE